MPKQLQLFHQTKRIGDHGNISPFQRWKNNQLKQKLMYNQTKKSTTTITGYRQEQGETIEKKVERIMINKEPIKDTAPTIYTDRKDGVEPQYDIRTDWRDMALELKDLEAKNAIAKRQFKDRTPPETKSPQAGGETPANTHDTNKTSPKE